MTVSARATFASLLLAVPVLAEAVHLIGGEGRGAVVLFAVSQLAGWGLVATVCRDLAAVTTSGRWGPRLVLGGVAAQGLFAAVYLATFAATGQPAEAAFLLFLAGFLALTAGGLVWARALRRSRRLAAGGLAAMSVLGFLAMALAMDPFHDIALIGSYLAWIGVGRGVVGDEAVLQRARPVLDAMGSRVFDCGREPGMGSTAKMINQLLCGVHIAAAAEAMHLAERAGVSTATMHEIISVSAGNSWMWGDRGPRMMQADPPVTSAVDIFVKDLGIVLGEARALKAGLPLAASAMQMFLAASGLGHGAADDSQVIRAYRALNGPGKKS